MNSLTMDFAQREHRSKEIDLLYRIKALVDLPDEADLSMRLGHPARAKIEIFSDSAVEVYFVDLAHAWNSDKWEYLLGYIARCVAHERNALGIGDKAYNLLIQCLNTDQRQDFIQLGHFWVQGSLGGHYKIKAGSMYNIHTIEDVRYCLVLDGRYPLPDLLLAQKLLLETDEAMFLEKANRIVGYTYMAQAIYVDTYRRDVDTYRREIIQDRHEYLHLLDGTFLPFPP